MPLPKSATSSPENNKGSLIVALVAHVAAVFGVVLSG